MKSYFLFEGSSSEPQVYPYWLSVLLPNIDQYTSDTYENFKNCDSGFFFISGEGYPQVLQRIENSVKDIQDIGDIDYFFVVIDCDESNTTTRENEILSTISDYLLPDRTRVIPIVQNRCFESMLLGNQRIIPRQSTQPPLSHYINYYDTSSHDPELMGNFNDSFTHAQFHAVYLKKATVAKRIRYAKNNCVGVMNEPYLNSLILRFKEHGHIDSFGRFISAVNSMREKLDLPHI
ncbi:hypothetical protein [Leucothrix arctica]|uniref:DUF4276 domain-containing protein n=1 Tax=Leucothrix arctica TaxID=1481894 RepID=A0A317CC77_9GAMM|nr:hypothetical protein [Leucothrix arctica]PWQ96234.1 hypothetical protein DKT75_09580 [Leucothrix arctica]